MTQPPHSIQWPAIVKLDADDELIFISDADEFANDKALRQMQLQAQDKLIDSMGAVFTIRNRPALTLTAAESALSLDAVEDLLRLHLSNHGTCCVSKFHANSIREALMSVFA